MVSLGFGPTWIKLHPNSLETIPTNPKDLLSGVTPNAYAQQFNAVLNWYATSCVCGQLPHISKSTLVITGTEDVSVPSPNSLIIQQKSLEHGLYRFRQLVMQYHRNIQIKSIEYYKHFFQQLSLDIRQ